MLAPSPASLASLAMLARLASTSPSASIPPGPRRRPCLEPPRSPAWPGAARNRPASIHVAKPAPHVPAGPAPALGERERPSPVSNRPPASLARLTAPRAPYPPRHRPSSHGRPACTRAGGLGHAGEDTARRRPRPSPCSPAWPVSNRPGPGRINFRSPARARSGRRQACYRGWPPAPALGEHERRRGRLGEHVARPASIAPRRRRHPCLEDGRRPRIVAGSPDNGPPAPASTASLDCGAGCWRGARQSRQSRTARPRPCLEDGRRPVPGAARIGPGPSVASMAARQSRRRLRPVLPAPVPVSPARRRRQPGPGRGPGLSLAFPRPARPVIRPASVHPAGAAPSIRRAVPGLHGPNSGPWRRPRKRRYLCHKAAIPASDRRGAA